MAPLSSQAIIEVTLGIPSILITGFAFVVALLQYHETRRHRLGWPLPYPLFGRIVLTRPTIRPSSIGPDPRSPPGTSRQPARRILACTSIVCASRASRASRAARAIDALSCGRKPDRRGAIQNGLVIYCERVTGMEGLKSPHTPQSIEHTSSMQHG
jgi:hypothetical protein